MTDRVEVGEPERPATGLHGQILERRRLQHEASSDGTTKRRRVQHFGNVSRNARRLEGLPIDVNPQRRGIDKGSAVGGTDARPALGPVSTDPTAPCLEIDLVEIRRKTHNVDHGAPHHPPVRIAPVGVTGIVVGDVLQEARHRIEPHPPCRGGIAEPHPSTTHESSALTGRVDHVECPGGFSNGHRDTLVRELFSLPHKGNNELSEFRLTNGS